MLVGVRCPLGACSSIHLYTGSDAATKIRGSKNVDAKKCCVEQVPKQFGIWQPGLDISMALAQVCGNDCKPWLPCRAVSMQFFASLLYASYTLMATIPCHTAKSGNSLTISVASGKHSLHVLSFALSLTCACIHTSTLCTYLLSNMSGSSRYMSNGLVS